MLCATPVSGLLSTLPTLHLTERQPRLTEQVPAGRVTVRTAGGRVVPHREIRDIAGVASRRMSERRRHHQHRRDARRFLFRWNRRRRPPQSAVESRSSVDLPPERMLQPRYEARYHLRRSIGSVPYRSAASSWSERSANGSANRCRSVFIAICDHSRITSERMHLRAGRLRRSVYIPPLPNKYRTVTMSLRRFETIVRRRHFDADVVLLTVVFVRFEQPRNLQAVTATRIAELYPSL